MWSSQNIKGQNKTGYPFSSITTDLYPRPKQCNTKQLQTKITGEIYDKLSKSS